MYFSQPSYSPAAAPLPHLPPEGFRLPEKLLIRTDLDQLIDYCTNAVSPESLLSPGIPRVRLMCHNRLQQIGFRERPFERAYFNLASIIAKVRPFRAQVGSKRTTDDHSVVSSRQFPWQRQDLWDAELREALFKCAHGESACRFPRGAL